MLEFNPILAESHFLHSFISVLHDEIKHSAKMFKPQMLEEAYELAENEEKKLDAIQRHSSYLKGTSSTQNPNQAIPFVRNSLDLKPMVDSKFNKSST